MLKLNSQFKNLDRTGIIPYCLSVIFGIGIYIRMVNNSFTESKALYYYGFSPNIYRFQTQLVLFLAKTFGFSFFILNSIIFIGVCWLIVFVINPTPEDQLIFFSIIFSFVFFPVLTDSLMYLILVLIVKFDNKKLIPILGFIKEFAVWQIAGYYLFVKKDLSKQFWMYLFSGLIVYLLDRSMVNIFIGNPTIPAGGIIYIFGFFYVIPFFDVIVNDYFLAGITLIGLLFIALLVVKTKNEFFLLLWNFIPIIFFGIWWESQLWVPIFLILLIHNKKSEQDLRINEELNNHQMS